MDRDVAERTMAVLAPPHLFFSIGKLAHARRVSPGRLVERALILDETVREQWREGRRVVMADEDGRVLDAFLESPPHPNPDPWWQVIPVPVTPEARHLLLQLAESRSEPMGAVLWDAMARMEEACRAGREGWYITILEPRGTTYGFIHPFRQT